MREVLDLLVPKFMRNALDVRRESRALASLPPNMCRAANLGTSVPDFAAQSVDSEWEAARTAVEQAGIGDKAGAVNPGDRRALYYLTRSLVPQSVLEIGTHLAASTAMFALAMKNSGAAQPRLVTVDIRDVNGADGAWVRLASAQPKQALSELNCDFVEFVTRPSVDFLTHCRESFDLIFLDGGHESTTVYREVPLALERLKPGGLILLHDFYPHARPLWSDNCVVAGPWLATQRFEREGVPIKAAPLGSLPWPTKLGSNMTSLACLVRNH